MAQQLKQLVVLVRTHEFEHGIHEGRNNSQEYPRFNLNGPVNEWGVLEIVQNMLELYIDGELTNAQLQHDCGLIVGWTLRACREG